jgi:hypothetical protein
MVGVMEELLEEIKKLRSEVNNLSAAGQESEPVLINGKAVIDVKEAVKISGIGRNNLIEQTKNGEWPYFKNGNQYKYPLKSFLKAMEEKSLKNMEEAKEELDFYQSVI